MTESELEKTSKRVTGFGVRLPVASSMNKKPGKNWKKRKNNLNKVLKPSTGKPLTKKQTKGSGWTKKTV
jgi:hypothetical protein